MDAYDQSVSKLVLTEGYSRAKALLPNKKGVTFMCAKVLYCDISLVLQTEDFVNV